MSEVCRKCKQEGLHYKYYELKERYVLFDNNEQPHLCSANPFDVQQSVDNFSNKFNSKLKKKIPIWCEQCDCHYRSDAVCGHILQTGFKEGIDDVTYFGLSFEAIELRKKRKAEINKLKEFTQSKRKAYPVDLTDFTNS